MYVKESTRYATSGAGDVHYSKPPYTPETYVYRLLELHNIKLKR